jgi:AcrR family transcriptional regulator
VPGSSSPPGADSQAGRIRSALIAIAGARGYPDTALAMVLDRAGVSESAFRSHFRDLDQCFDQVWEAVAAELADALARAVADGSGWKTGMRLATRAAAEFLAADPPRARFLVLEAERRPVTRALRGGYLARIAFAIDSVREELADAARLSPATAEAIAGSLYDLVSSRLRRGGVGEADSLAAEFRYLIVMPYSGLRAAEAELDEETG